jgi:hypothetical protein
MAPRTDGGGKAEFARLYPPVVPDGTSQARTEAAGKRGPAR